MVTMQRNALSDLHFTIDNVIGEGDWLATQLSWSGTFTGKLGDIEPTGKKVNMKQVVITRYVDGKTVEAHPYLDTLSLYQQLGVSPPTQ